MSRLREKIARLGRGIWKSKEDLFWISGLLFNSAFRAWAEKHSHVFVWVANVIFAGVLCFLVYRYRVGLAGVLRGTASVLDGTWLRESGPLTDVYVDLDGVYAENWRQFLFHLTWEWIGDDIGAITICCPVCDKPILPVEVAWQRRTDLACGRCGFKAAVDELELTLQSRVRQMAYAHASDAKWKRG